jgi:hypothetical protein
MRRAADDERRHADLCARLARQYGEDPGGDAADVRIAPPGFGPREAALYETVAACCVTETASVATVASLLAADALPEVRDALHEIARDEVAHGRMGWAHLAREAAAHDVSFLGRFVEPMLAAAAGEGLFAAGDAALESPELLLHGVLPLSQKREIFVQTLGEVVFPGLEQFGIDAGPGRAWLSEQSRAGGGGNRR